MVPRVSARRYAVSGANRWAVFRFPVGEPDGRTRLLRHYPTDKSVDYYRIVLSGLRFALARGFELDEVSCGQVASATFFPFSRRPSPACYASMNGINREQIRASVQAALAEDVGSGDATTLATVPDQAEAAAVMAAREPIVVAGLQFAIEAFQQLAPAMDFVEQRTDGDAVPPGASLLNVRGPARAILTAERVALNFVQRLSGIATLTKRFVDAVAGTSARILDTRKTTPGWRQFEKYAVTCGGGSNHRHGLYDMILIKDNHLAALRGEKPNAIGAAVARARALYPQLKIEVEADTLEQVEQALKAGTDIVLLDNMSLDELRAAVDLNHGRARLEASGGVSLETVRAIAETGVDLISVGALTHSARSVDIGLDFQ
jgi:nicotinate-nucleotide pyrophosphorylase (carboxylating)